ncbi:MAG: hypothetical protein RLZZ53_2228 [Acidobacteriota bacterium]
MSRTVLAAIDLGPSSARVLYHAAGFARLMSASLKVLHVTGDPGPDDVARVLDFCAQEGPYEIDLMEEDVIVRSGRVSDAIYREAERQKAALVVMGSRGHGGLTRLLLGSSSEAVLQNAATPVLLVPPIDIDIVNIADRATLSCGPVLAAVDLEADTGGQLRLAGDLAAMAGQPWTMMTVAPRSVDEHAAATELRERAHQMTANKPHSLIVRRGRVADEISRCALTEGAGLVVMGLRERAKGRPGAVASSVLATKRAFVLAVPGSR